MASSRSLSLRIAATTSLCALIAGWPAVAGAQSTTGGASAASDPTAAISLPPVTVTADKVPTEEAKSESATTVIGAQTIRTQAAPDNLSEVVNLVPGATAVNSGQDPGLSINMRGLEGFGRVAVLVDGARQNFGTMTHGVDGSFYLDPEMLASVDITRGPIANAYGTGAIGGVAAFSTISADDLIDPGNSWGARLRTSYSTNGSRLTGHGEFATKLGDDLDTLVAATVRKDHSYEDGAGDTQFSTGQKLVSGLAKFRYRPAEGHELSVSAIAYHNDFGSNATPGTRTSTYRDVTVDADTFVVNYRFNRPDIWWADSNVNVYYTRTESSQDNLTGTTAGSTRSFTIETTGFDANNTMRFATGPVTHALTYGLDGFHDELTNVAGSSSDDGPFFNPSGHRNVYGGFIQNQARWRWFDLTTALRGDGYNLAGNGVDNSGSHLSPKVIFGVSPIENVTFYTSYSEGYRSPSLTETLITGYHPPPANFLLFEPNPNLKAETAHNKEVGVNVKFNDVIGKGDRLTIKANYFNNKVNDYIDLQSTGSGSLSTSPYFYYAYQYVNVANAQIEGVELKADYDGGWVFGSVSGQKMRGKNLATGAALTTVPADRVTTTLGFRPFDERLTVGGQADLVSAQKRVTSAASASDNYTLLNLFISGKITDRITAGMYLDNITDKYYTPYLDEIASPGFSAKFVLDIKFGG